MRKIGVRWRWLGPVPGLVLSACAQLPSSVTALPWVDAWGDRGSQVFARDYAMCEALVEQRRSLLAGCLAARGWSLPPG